MNKSRFEQIVGNIDVVKILLEGALKDWGSSFDIWVNDSESDYLFSSKDNAPDFRRFCRTLRSYETGEKLCRACDAAFANRIARNPTSIDNNDMFSACHVGLIDAAVPIFFGDGDKQEHLATVFFGQARPDNDQDDLKHLRKIDEFEKKIGIENGDLKNLSHEIPRKSRAEFEEARDRVKFVIDHMIEMGRRAIELKNSGGRRERRKLLTQAFEDAGTLLSNLSTNDDNFWSEYWQNVGAAIGKVAQAVDVPCGMVITVNPAAKKCYVKAVFGLNTKYFESLAFEFYDPVFEKLRHTNDVIEEPLNQFREPNTISGSIAKSDSVLASKISCALLRRIDLASDSRYGILLFCFDDDTQLMDTLALTELKSIMIQLSSLISYNYKMTKSYRLMTKELKERYVWLEKVTHQVIAPINAVRGHAENASIQLEKWISSNNIFTEKVNKNELDSWKSTFESIMWTAVYAARLASNLAYVSYEDRKDDKSYSFSVQNNVAGLLIKSARNFQGMAKARGLGAITVKTETLKAFDGILCINVDLFRQSIENLIDNAVKYSHINSGTDIIIEGKILNESEKCIITVSNQGIRLREEDVESIFDDGERTLEARNHNAPGTGIGLFVARALIEKHDGTLIAFPSEEMVDTSWLTTFIITLPFGISCE